jgi:Sensors of blue-light using FAD
MLVRCLYASRAESTGMAALFTDILKTSRKNNSRHGITGVLLTTNDIFIQLLEGGRSEVCSLYNAIVHDARHRDVTLLIYEEIAERRFENWTMGQISMEKVNPALILKYSEKAELNPFYCSGHATLAIISELMQSGSIISR